MNWREARGGPGEIADLAGLVLAIFGPTASGKSAVAEALADLVPAEIVAADSMQTYQGVPILTNQAQMPTHLMGIWPLDYSGSVAEYAVAAHETIDAIMARKRVPVVVGGTGLYFRAALAELDMPPPVSSDARVRWDDRYGRVGGARLHAELAERDPVAAARLHPNDRKRVVRALELAEAGHSLAPERDRLWTAETRHPTLVFGLAIDPATLERRIEVRTREMITRGAAEEARRAPPSTAARQVIGLRELNELDGEDAIRAIIDRTRRYAAYQRKWMRRIPNLVMLDGERDPRDIASRILAIAHAGRDDHGLGAPLLR